MNRLLTFGLISAFSIASLSGCSRTISLSNQTNHKAVKSSVGLYPVPEKIKNLSHPDGTIASLTPYTIKGQNPYIKLYKMFYWSAGKKVEAFVSEPTDNGKYPLLIGCHGGYVISYPKMHASSLETLSGIAHDTALYVEVDPMYRGYGDSQGTVQNVSQNTLDAENAIKAARTLKDVNRTELYVSGTSMGGAVALMLAERPDVKAVVAKSPWVGWSINGEWAMKNADQSQLAVLRWNEALARYGPVKPDSPIYQRESPDISKIKAPVLILQGTGDKVVPWQTVQDFVKDMKSAGKKIRLVLYPGGDHALTKKYTKDAIYEENTWFTEYGLNLF